MQIGEAAAISGLGEHTLRYYEKVGLLPQIERDASGLRRFTGQDLRWLSFLTKLRATRMPLKDMRRYADLVRQGDASLGERRAMLEQHEQKVKATIAEMQASLESIQLKLELYRGWEEKGRSDPSDYDALRKKKGL